MAKQPLKQHISGSAREARKLSSNEQPGELAQGLYGIADAGLERAPMQNAHPSSY
jgi:hypothetical protein